GGGETVAVFRCWINPEVNVFGECRRAVEDSGLPAYEQILDAAIAKALEKVCDHARPWGRGDANASANCGSTVPAESVAAKCRLCKVIVPRVTSGRKLRFPNLV